jgi:hypothetical protein
MSKLHTLGLFSQFNSPPHTKWSRHAITKRIRICCYFTSIGGGFTH